MISLDFFPVFMSENNVLTASFTSCFFFSVTYETQTTESRAWPTFTRHKFDKYNNIYPWKKPSLQSSTKLLGNVLVLVQIRPLQWCINNTELPTTHPPSSSSMLVCCCRKGWVIVWPSKQHWVRGRGGGGGWGVKVCCSPGGVFLIRVDLKYMYKIVQHSHFS